MNQFEKTRLKRRARTIAIIVKFALLLVILVGVPLYLWFFHQDLLRQFADYEASRKFFETYRTQSIYILLGLQVVQILISIIPGQGIQFVAGLFYGFWPGLLLSLAGALVGTVLTYYVASFLGRDALYLFFGERKVDAMLAQVNSKRGMILVFLIYLFPGLPKDLCTYAAGISRMKLPAFLIISLVGRTPAMMGSLLIGMGLGRGDYTTVIIIGIIAVVFFILGAVFHNRLSIVLDRIYTRLFRSK